MGQLWEFAATSWNNAIAWEIGEFDVIFKCTLLLSIAWLVAAVFRNASAAFRHFVWTAALAGSLTLLLTAPLHPTWRLANPWLEVLAEDLHAIPAQHISPALAQWNADTDLRPTTRQEPTSTPTLPTQSTSTPATPTKASQPSLAASLWRTTLQYVVLPLGLLASVVWAIGALLLLGCTLFAHAAVRNTARHGLPVQSPDLDRLAQEIARESKIWRRVTLRHLPGLGSPLVCGLFRPVVMLPLDFADWDEERQRVILTHEIAHVRRFDCLSDLLGQVTGSLLWFHPLVWYGIGRMRIEREQACDDAVVGRGFNPIHYATHLLEIAASHTPDQQRWASAAALGIVRSTPLEQRISQLLKQQGRPRRTSLALLLLIAGLLCSTTSALAVTTFVAARPLAGTSSIEFLSTTALPLKDSVPTASPNTTRSPLQPTPLATSKSLAEFAPIPRSRQRFTSIDLQHKANWTLENDFHDNVYTRNNLAALAPGNQELGGVEFLVGRRAIQMSGRFLENHPREVDGLHVGSKIEKLHLLQATGWGAYGGPENRLGHWVPDGTLLGRYEVLYADGTVESIPIVYGVDLRDWWCVWDDNKPCSRADVVWRGTNKHLQGRDEARQYNDPLRLFHVAWTNPKPDVVVESVRIVVGNQPAAPFCVAMTAEHAVPALAAAQE